MAATTPICDFGWKAQDATLSATDGRDYSIKACAGEKGLVVAFICNHCPYVLGVIDRLVEDAAKLRQSGIGFVAICSNDATAYPEDSFGRMKVFAEEYGFTFPYLHDETQAVARAYGAVCTPDFFGFNAAGELQYRGRLDAYRKDDRPAEGRSDLVDAMVQIAETGKGPAEQFPSMGCSIKWR
ncbi:thioredoxin family protein [Stappia sp. F7233]|uniref:Thioredoxin family protein n=1 Tax=Stappia albiluteola TaxID=2758565 RepID=A0A839A9P7_9HYPH|nr:thioredoxin family protein [Stappia albiluteola]MBA5775672.1 thioredoxin family protein [Stappia albiluteola]